MSHIHQSPDHGHIHSKERSAPQAIVVAILITILFMIVELIGGWLSNSLALISDAAHMLTDVGAMLLSLFAIWVARKPTTPTMSFGYHRAEILGALISGLLIWMISGILVFEAFHRIQSAPEVKGPIVFVVASIGLMGNLWSMAILHSKRNSNLNVRAAYLHLLSDSLGSVAAIIAGVVLWYTNWKPIDPIITIVFAILMLVSSWSLIKEAIGVLMESTPTHIDPSAIHKELNAILGVEETHDLHVWALSSGRLALCVHLITKNNDAVLSIANQMLQEKFGIIHTTIQLEHPQLFQSDRCYDCVPVENLAIK